MCVFGYQSAVPSRHWLLHACKLLLEYNLAVQQGLAAIPAKPPPDFVLPRSDIERSSSYDLESYDLESYDLESYDFEDLLEGSLDRADAPPPAGDTCNTVFDEHNQDTACQSSQVCPFLDIKACKHLIVTRTDNLLDCICNWCHSGRNFNKDCRMAYQCIVTVPL